MTNEYHLERLKRFECSDATASIHNPSLVFAKAKGCWVWDVAGRKYLDLCAGFGVHALGHNPDVFTSLWQSQLSDQPPVVQAMGDVYPSLYKVQFLEALVELLPQRLTRAALSLSGGQAVEFALKSAFLKTGASGVIAATQCYHGLDMGSLAVTFRQDFRMPFSEWLPTTKVAFVNFNCEDLDRQFADALTFLDEPLAAVIVEPIQGRGGVVVPGSGWLERLGQLCHENQALFILDEIFTGLGRTGCFSQAETLSADLVCLGKPLGGGMPLSACVGTNDAMSGWPDNKGEALHTGTFFGHALSCRMGEALLRELVEKRLIQSALEKGLAWRQELQDKCSAHLKEIRGRGLMLGLDLGEPGRAIDLMHRLRREGVIALPSGPDGATLSLTPPLVIDEQEMALATDRIYQALAN